MKTIHAKHQPSQLHAAENKPPTSCRTLKPTGELHGCLQLMLRGFYPAYSARSILQTSSAKDQMLCTERTSHSTRALAPGT
jgi:hypothetical protein